MAGTAERHGCSAALVRCVCVCPLFPALFLPACWPFSCAEVRVFAHACMHVDTLVSVAPPLPAFVGPDALVAHSLPHVSCACFIQLRCHPTELDHWVDDPTDPRMLAADRRLAALTASLGSDSPAAMAAAMV